MEVEVFGFIVEHVSNDIAFGLDLLIGFEKLRAKSGFLLIEISAWVNDKTRTSLLPGQPILHPSKGPCQQLVVGVLSRATASDELCHNPSDDSDVGSLRLARP